MEILTIRNLNVSLNEKKILNNIELSINKGEVTFLLGPNGAGKSTIAHSIMGNNKFKKEGEIIFEGEDISNLETSEIAKKGIFLSFQHPIEIDGVTMANFLRTTYNKINGTNMKTKEFFELLDEKLEFVGLDKSFRRRFLNVGFSGGEKKRSELLTLLLFEPKLAMLDEIDSGLDRDGFLLLKKCVDFLRNKKNTSFLIITHSTKIVELLEPNEILVLKKGSIINKGGLELAKKIEKSGF